MSSYYRDQGFYSRRPLYRHLKLVFWLIVISIVALGGFFAWDLYKQSQTDTSSKLSAPINSTVVSSSSIQTTKFFQFQVPKRWRAIANETSEGHYVYRQYNGPLVEQELTIEVNGQSSEVLALVQTTNVLPVTVSDKGNLQPQGEVSEHCKKYVKPPGARNPQIVVFNKVSFACSPDSTRAIAVVGLVGGNTTMKLPRPDGTTASYNITYNNLTAVPSFRDLKNIVETFETR